MHFGGSAKTRVSSFVAQKTSRSGSKTAQRASRVAALLLLGTALAAAPASASTDTWYGNSSVNWSDTGNWVGGAAPTTGQDVIILPGSNSATNNFAPNTLDSSYTLNSLTLGQTTNGSTATSGYDITTSNSSKLTFQSGGFISDISGNTGVDHLNIGIAVSGSTTVTVGSGTAGLVFDQGISGTGPVTFANNSGAGSLVLLGSSSYTGGTNIVAGTLQLGNGTTNGTITGDVSTTTNTALAFNEHSAVTYAGVISGGGGVTQNGAGAITFTGANTYSGNTTINVGSLILGDGTHNGTIVSNVVTSGGTLLQFNEGTSVTYAGAISGGGQVEQSGPGTVIFTGANTYTGGTTIDLNRTLQIGSDTLVGSISASGNVSDSGVLDFHNTTSNFQYGGVISGGGSVSIDQGTIIYTKVQTYTGGTTIGPAGTLQIGTASAVGGLNQNGAVTDSGTLTFANIGAGGETLSGGITGTGTLSLALQGTNGPLVLTGTNSVSAVQITTGTLQIGNSTTPGTLAGNVSLGTGTLDFANTGATPLTFSNSIQGAGTLEIGALGDVILTNANNSVVGGTTIDTGGMLQIGDGTTNTGSLYSPTIVDNGTLAFAPPTGQTLSISSVISGSGGVTQTGGGTTVLTGASSFNGNSTVTAGTLEFGAGASLSGTGSFTVDNGATLAFAPSTAFTFANAITGGGTLSVAGSAPLVLTNDNTGFTGATTIAAGGTLQIGSNTTAGSITNTSGVTIAAAGTLSFVNPSSSTFSAPISGMGAVTVGLTSGALILSGTNTYSGGTNLEGGTLQVASASNLGTGAVNFTNGATLQFSSANAFTQGATVGNGGGTFDTNGQTITWSGLISGTGGLTLNDSAVTPGTLILTGTDNYSGPTTITSGNLQLGNGTTNGTVAGAVSIASGQNLIFDEATAVTDGSTLTGNGSVTQEGAGAVTLSGTNTYTGGTTVGTGSTLRISADANLGNGGTVALAQGSTLATTSTNTFAHAVTVSGDPTFNVASGTIATWSGLISDGTSAGTVNVAGGGTLVLTNTSNSYSGGTIVLGNSTLGIDSDGELGAPAGGLTLGDSTSNTGGTLDVSTNSFTLGAGRTVALAGPGGTVKTETGVTFEIANGITGSGALTVTGPGTFVLAGASTYTGNTNIAAGGTLQLGDGTVAGTIASTTVNNAGALVFNEAGDLEFSSTIQGTGSVTQNDTAGGTLTLVGAEGYTGGTTITLGTLQLGDGANLGTVTGDITNNSALVFNEPANVTYGGTISGSGSLTVKGTKTVVLTGNNTYTGATNINTGATLQVGNGGASGSIANSSSIVNNGTLTIDVNGQTILTGGITGTGQLSQIGSGGTTILAGTNTYSGGTTVSSGTLQIGNAATSGSLTGNISNGGAVVFNRTDTSIYAGNITGTGTVTQAGTGTTVLTGTNTYSGSTAITAGTLQVGNAGTSGSITGNVNVGNNGTLAFNRTDASVYNGVITGAGAVNQVGIGSTILTGNSTYTGPTTVTHGTLQIGNGGTSGSITSNIANSGNVTFNRTDSSTYAGNITGTGSLTQAGTGTTALTGTNTYSGGTSITAGTLQLGSASAAGSITGDVADNGTLAFDRSNSYVFNGVISGSGGVTQSGQGETTLTAAETYTGPTHVTGGTLLINGSIAPSVTTVSSGGSIGGTGTVGQLTVTNNGTVTTGSGGIGTLTVNGNFILGPGATYMVGVTPTAHDLLAVNGTATLQGALTVTPSGTGFSTTPIEILSTTGGLNGTTFSSFTVFGGPNQIPLLSYTTDDVYLTFAPTVTSLLPSLSTETNQSRVADAVDFALTHDNAIALQAVTGETGATLLQTLSELSGEAAVGFQNIAVASTATFMNTLFDPSIGGRGGLGAGSDGITDSKQLEQLAFNGANSDVPYQHPSLRAVTVWTDAYGYESTTDANTDLGSHRTKSSQYGGTVGLDYRPRKGDGSLGIAVGMSGNTWNLSNQLGKGEATAYQIGAYYSRRFLDSYITGGLSYARYSATTDRTVNLGGANLYHADFVSNAIAARAEAGHVFHTDIGRITPFARFQADDIGVPHYAEQTQAGSSAYALTYQGKQHYDYTSELGAGWSTLLDRWTDLHARAGWLHDYAGGLSNIATFSEFNGASFTVDGASPPRDAAHFVLGIAHNVNNVVFSLNGEAAVAGASTTYGGSASIAYRW